MKQVMISVEGQTEETFVKEVLAGYLRNYNVNLIPVILTTKKVKQGHRFQGGITSYGKIEKEIQRLLGNTNAVAITTMYDLYKLPQDFPGYLTKPVGNCYSKVTYLENEFKQKISNYRFTPYLQAHEFEAFLFVSPEITARNIPEVNMLHELIRIRSEYNSPEEINDGENTAPSKRILRLFPNYEKPLYGAMVALDVGLTQIRKDCPHFNEWLSWLEGLGSL